MKQQRKACKLSNADSCDGGEEGGAGGVKKFARLASVRKRPGGEPPVQICLLDKREAIRSRFLVARSETWRRSLLLSLASVRISETPPPQ